MTMFKTMFLKPFLFLLVLLNVLSLHIYLFYNFSVPQRGLETKKESDYIVTLTMIHEESEKVVNVNKKLIVKKEKVVSVKKRDVHEQVIKVDKEVTAKKKSIPKKIVEKETIPEKVVKKEDLDISDEKKREEKKKTSSEEITTKDHDKRAEIRSVESDKSEERVLDAKRQDEYFNEYISYIDRTIQENKFFPKTAKNMGIEGRCTIKLTILNSGVIKDVKIVENSYFAIFDRSALKIIKRIGSFKAFPKSLKRDTVIIQIPIKYTIEG